MRLFVVPALRESRARERARGEEIKYRDHQQSFTYHVLLLDEFFTSPPWSMLGIFQARHAGITMGLLLASLLVKVLSNVYVGGDIGFFPITFEPTMYVRGAIFGFIIGLVQIIITFLQT